jgi:hypothetical protein
MPLVILGSTTNASDLPALQELLDDWSKWGDNYTGERIQVIHDPEQVRDGRDYEIEYGWSQDQRDDIAWQVGWFLSERRLLTDTA